MIAAHAKFGARRDLGPGWDYLVGLGIEIAVDICVSLFLLMRCDAFDQAMTMGGDWERERERERRGGA
jgi:hypothetical protein